METVGNILPNLSVTLSYANCLAKVTQSLVPSEVGMRVENAPRNTSGSWIKYTFDKGPLKGLGVSAGHSQVGWRATYWTLRPICPGMWSSMRVSITSTNILCWQSMRLISPMKLIGWAPTTT